MNKEEKEFIERIKTKVAEVLEGKEDLTEDQIDKMARNIENVRKFRVKDYGAVRDYFRSVMHFMEDEVQKTGYSDSYIIIRESERVITQVIEKRRRRNRKLSKIDTNIITHAPYFVGGKRGRKQKAREEKYIFVEKGGLRKLTYENNLGEMLTMADARVLFALFTMWEDQGYREWVSFTEYQVIKLTGLKDGGRQYRLVRDSLERLWNTSIVMQEAYNVTSGRREVTQRFKLIVEDKISKDYSEQGDLRSKNYKIKFSEYIAKSIEDRYYTLISLAVFNELQSGTSQGLYIMLMGIYDMDNNETYIRDDGSVVVKTKEVYDTLFLENRAGKNRGVVENGCEELKEVGVIDDYYFNYEGQSAKSLVIVPSGWLQEVIKKTNKIGIEQKDRLE